MKTAALALAVVLSVAASPATRQPGEMARWEQQAQNVTITRDDWGIAHVRGKTDADAVFGMIYAQAEDDFNRVETNFINSQGRLAEAEGEGAIYRDLRMKLFIHPDSMKAKYATSPEWLKKLMVAWADGLNYYLATHPNVKPRVITRFEPWMALTFSEGSIGGDIESISLAGLEGFYGKPAAAPTGSGETQLDREPRGSNGIAIHPSITTNNRAMLLINPHTSFFFRSELQMTSDEGLNAYGAATWGQFFIYQGFNDRLGWMHTTSGADAVDEYAETVLKKGDGFVYRYGSGERPVVAEKVRIPYRTAAGTMATREFTVYRTHHGPIVREANGKWVSVKLMQEPVKALMQSYGRTKARTIDEYRRTMALQANTSNNTLYADADGNVAFFYTNFMPKRDPKFDWTRPVDGSDPATEWKGLHTYDEVPNLVNPPSGWVYNANDWPWDAGGRSTIDQKAFPAYVERGRNEMPRGTHALLVLGNKRDFNMQRLIDAAYDSYQPAFATSIPALVRAWDQLPDTSALKKRTAEQIAMLRAWDFRWGVTSIPNSLAVYYSQQGGGGRRGGGNTTPEQLVQNLAAASDRLTADFGTWKTPWGEINRFQRNDGNIVQQFDDSKPSTPVGFSSATWGSLASFGARTYPGTKRMYGTSGNSFVAVVEFGRDSVRARAVSAGGESGDPKSKHFNDQAERYATGNLRAVSFYPGQLTGHTERTYKPGQ
ncbi:MAG TPA: penicillin acylase family protein [Gemmatimonadaceae bacterium]|nr:penicillin acylase family protein [Gemmatimonadaceae bacterium]